MIARLLSDADRLVTGFTHKYTITFRDLYREANTSLAVVLDAYVAGTRLADAAYRLETAFDGGTTSGMKLDVGWNGATTDDADGAIDDFQVHEDGTEVLYAGANGAAFATLLTGYTALDAGNWEALFTATGGNLTELDTGVIHIYLKIVNLNSY